MSLMNARAFCPMRFPTSEWERWLRVSSRDDCRGHGSFAQSAVHELPPQVTRVRLTRDFDPVRQNGMQGCSEATGRKEIGNLDLGELTFFTHEGGDGSDCQAQQNRR